MSTAKWEVVLALIAILTPLWSQDAPLVRTNTRLVLLDVVVTDKNGHPIRGLSQKDFSVLENGAAQKVNSFEEASTDGANAQTSASRNLILLDELNVPFSDLAFARDRVIEFLDKNPARQHPTCLMAVGMRGLIMVQDYTEDSALLKDKLSHLKATLANQKGDDVDNDLAEPHAKAALQALTEIARAAVGSPFSVNVIWITGGFPGLVQTATANDQVDAGLRSVSNLLIRSRMRLYTIDPTGVVPMAAMADAAKLTRGATSDSHTSAAEQMMNSTHGQAMTADVLLRHMTKIMGGLSYRGRNDVEEALSQAIEDGSSAYLISYSPSNETFDGKYRKIDVSIDVPGAVARTRQGYYAVSDDFTPDRQIADARLENALQSPVSYGALNVQCPAKYDPGTNRLTGKIVVKPVQSVAGADQKDQVIRVASFSKDRKVLNSWLWRVSWKDPWTNREVSASFDKVLAPKSSVVRFVVSDSTGDRIGSCEYPVR